jgi:hypothetical protein
VKRFLTECVRNTVMVGAVLAGMFPGVAVGAAFQFIDRQPARGTVRQARAPKVDGLHPYSVRGILPRTFWPGLGAQPMSLV